MDTFELAAAVAEITGQQPSTKQVHAMVAMADANKSNTLSLKEFEALVRKFDWDGDYSGNLSEGTYELQFPNRSLGFRVFNVPERGTIAVSILNDPSIVGKVGLRDTVLAVNGAPLGFIKDSKILAKKVGPLKRPVTITFERFAAQEAPEEVPEAPTMTQEGFDDGAPNQIKEEHTFTPDNETTFEKDPSAALAVAEQKSPVEVLEKNAVTLRQDEAAVELQSPVQVAEEKAVTPRQDDMDGTAIPSAMTPKVGREGQDAVKTFTGDLAVPPTQLKDDNASSVGGDDDDNRSLGRFEPTSLVPRGTRGLPPGWYRIYSKSYKAPFYHNVETKESTWIHPSKTLVPEHHHSDYLSQTLYKGM